MSDHSEDVAVHSNNVVSFPPSSAIALQPPPYVGENPETPLFNKMIEEAKQLDKVSKYPCSFDYTIYRNLEQRYKDRPIRGGVVKRSPFKLVNAHSSCQQCLYSFEMDTYGRGCSHNCIYCYAKAELTVHGMWNNPIPVPVDLNEIRKTFYTVFETDKKTKWRQVMENKVPLRIGCMSDSFMWSDTKYGVTRELLKILNFYEYPHTIFTRSDLVARDDYMSLLDKRRSSVQFSISSTNDAMNRQIEPGAPSAARRLKAIEKLVANGNLVAVRINPMFPIFPDGYFTNPNFSSDGPAPQFDYSSFEMVDEIADAGTPAIICGFGRFSSYALNNIQKATGVDLRPFFNRELTYKSARDWHYSDKEIRHYYEEVKRRCVRRAVEFTVCYIGNGEKQFWETQDLWSNKADCCNIKGKVAEFKTDSRQVPFDVRVKFSGDKNSKPVNQDLLHVHLGESLAPPRSSTSSATDIEL